MFFGKNCLIGLDIGSSSIKMVELKKEKGSYHMNKFGMSPIPEGLVSGGEIMDPLLLSNMISELYNKLGVKKGSFCTGVFGGAVLIKKIVVPRMDKKTLNEQIQWEAEQHIPFDIEESFIDFHILKGGSQQEENMSVLLVVARRNLLAGYFEAIESIGLRCDIIDVNSFALANCFEVNYGLREETISLIDIGAKVVSIVIIKNGDITFCRDIPMGGFVYDMEIIREMSVSIEEASDLKVNFSKNQQGPSELETIIRSTNQLICNEIKETFKVYETSEENLTVNEVFLSGGSINTKNLIQSIEDTLSIKCEIFNPFQEISYSEKDFSQDFIEEISSSVPCVLGLGMRSYGW